MFTTAAFCDVIKTVANNDNNDKFKDLAKLKANTILGTLSHDYETVFASQFSLVAYGLVLLGYNVFMPTESERPMPGFIPIDRTLSTLAQAGEKYDLVLAVDQATTYADTNANQQQLVNDLASVTGKTLVCTLRDYKNQHSNEKMFDDPFYLRYNTDQEYVFLNHRKWDNTDKQSWDHYLYVIDENQDMVTIGPVKRRTMYFKQLAKFLHDNNVKDFQVHKSPMYKSVFSRNFEYIITADF